jgi:hypothetical protein
MFRKKDLEKRCVAAVARVRGGTPEDENGQWPDGWISDPSGTRIPIEVVSAFPETKGSAFAGAFAKAEAKARRIEEEAAEVSGRDETGTVPWTVRGGRGFVLDGHTRMPVSTRPVDPVVGILAAIEAKAKHYGRAEASSSILAVHHVQWAFRLDAGRLRRIADHAAQIGAPFREIWIVNEYGDPAQRVPFGDQPEAHSATGIGG